MNPSGQTQATHIRWHPLFHFVLMPLLTFHLVCMAVRLWNHPDWDSAEALLLAVALIILGFLSRVNALKAQDRIIRLEERLRYQRVLPPELAARACSELNEGQSIALRFASDDELPELSRQVLAGKLEKPAEIKKAIKNWRGDYFRV